MKVINPQTIAQVLPVLREQSETVYGAVCCGRWYIGSMPPVGCRCGKPANVKVIPKEATADDVVALLSS